MRKRARSLSLKSASILDFFPQLRYEVGVSVVKSSEQEHILMRRKKTKQQRLQCRSYICTSHENYAAKAMAGAIVKNASLRAMSLEGNPLGAGGRDILAALLVLSLFLSTCPLPSLLSPWMVRMSLCISREFKPPRLSSVDEGHTV
jgi:hypothetical protein